MCDGGKGSRIEREQKRGERREGVQGERGREGREVGGVEESYIRVHERSTHDTQMYCSDIIVTDCMTRNSSWSPQNCCDP